MTEPNYDWNWQVIGKTVRGAAHMRAKLPNQDALCWWSEAGDKLPLIVAISDGHGSENSFRSNIGSQFAVKTALTVIKQFLEGQSGLNDLSAIKRTAEERLPQELVRSWHQKVQEHIKDNEDLSTSELKRLSQDIVKNWQAEQVSQKTITTKDSNPKTKPSTNIPTHLLAYGATLLIVVITEAFIIYLQLGDGDILTVSEAHEVTRPLPKDQRLIANETTSLCSPNAWREFRVAFKVLTDSPPALILLSTDGYSNSFRNEDEFLKIGPDFLGMIQANGSDNVNKNLERWLIEASTVGSGDDITLAIIKRVEEGDRDLIKKSLVTLKTEFFNQRSELENITRTLEEMTAKLNNAQKNNSPTNDLEVDRDRILQSIIKGQEVFQAQSREFKKRISTLQQQSKLQWAIIVATLVLIGISLMINLILWTRTSELQVQLSEISRQVSILTTKLSQPTPVATPPPTTPLFSTQSPPTSTIVPAQSNTSTLELIQPTPSSQSTAELVQPTLPITPTLSGEGSNAINPETPGFAK